MSSAVTVGGLRLSHPLVNASGTLDAFAADAAFGDATLGFAAHVTKTITPEPRAGNPMPRLADLGHGLLNSIGLPGPGLEKFVGEWLPRLRQLCDVPLVVSVGGFSPGDYEVTVDRLEGEPGVAAVELNVSCPNVHSGCSSIGADAGETERVTAAARRRTQRPLLVKLSPGVPDIAEIARAAEAGGADALTLVNTVRGAVWDRYAGRPALGAGAGGISGPALRAVALAAVLVCRAAVGVDLLAVGGVESGADAADLLAAGAAAVGVGSALLRDPGAGRRILADLEALVPVLGNAAGAGDSPERSAGGWPLRAAFPSV